MDDTDFALAVFQAGALRRTGHLKKLGKAARKTVVALIGFPLLALGLILIPLPGPGLLVCLAALFILALEFEWAKKHHIRIKTQLKKLIEKAKLKT